MLNRTCPICHQEKSIPTLLTQCFNCWYSSEERTNCQALLDKISQDPNQAINQLYADAHNGQFFNHPEQTWEQLQAELITERETTQEALRTSQEWHERQKREITAEWTNKYQALISKWHEARMKLKTTIQQEITLLRQILNSHD